MRPLYSLNHYICPKDVGLLTFLDTAVEHGFVGVGLTERALAEVPPEKLGHELRSRRLRVTSLNSAGHFLHADPQVAARQSAHNEFLVAAAAELGDAPLNVYSGGIGQVGGTMSLPDARALAAVKLVALHEAMQRAGVAMVFEPIHPMSIWVRSVFNTLSDSTALIEGLADSAINLDLFHSWWDADLDRFIAEPKSRLGLVQISDVDHSSPDGIPRRVPLGEGTLDIPGLLRAILRRPEPPRIEVELFAFQLEHRDFADVLASTVRYLQDIDATL